MRSHHIGTLVPRVGSCEQSIDMATQRTAVAADCRRFSVFRNGGRGWHQDQPHSSESPRIGRRCLLFIRGVGQVVRPRVDRRSKRLQSVVQPIYLVSKLIGYGLV